MSLPPKRSRPAARDLERYAGLFASRTKVMKSSAMRDLMAITERPEVISLAGGLPDTCLLVAHRPARPRMLAGEHELEHAAEGVEVGRRPGFPRFGIGRLLP